MLVATRSRFLMRSRLTRLLSSDSKKATDEASERSEENKERQNPLIKRTRKLTGAQYLLPSKTNKITPRVAEKVGCRPRIIPEDFQDLEDEKEIDLNAKWVQHGGQEGYRSTSDDSSDSDGYEIEEASPSHESVHKLLHAAVKDKPFPINWKEIETLSFLTGPHKPKPVNASFYILKLLVRLGDAPLMKDFIMQKGGFERNHITVTSNYLKICKDPEEIMRVWEIVKPFLKNTVLDTGTTFRFVDALSRTPIWREAPSVIEAGGKEANDWTIRRLIVRRMLQDGDDDTAFKWAQESIDLKLDAVGDEFAPCLKDKEKSIRLLNFIADNGIAIRSSLATHEDWKIHFKPRVTDVSTLAKCCRCGHKLPPKQDLDETEWRGMVNLAEKLLVKTSLLQKDHDDISALRKFMKHFPAYDVVLDGLNLTFRVTFLEHVLRQCTDNGLRTLFVARNHIRRQVEKKKGKYIFDTFFTHDFSHDDSFVLLGAMLAGQRCKFVSADLFRDSRYKMTMDYVNRFQPHLISTQESVEQTRKNLRNFKQWLHSNYYRYDMDRSWSILSKKISPIASEDPNGWHVPVSDHIYEHHWLCILKR